MTRGEVARRLLGMLRPLAPLMAASASARVINQGLGVVIPAVAAAFVVGIAASSGIGAMAVLLVALALVKGLFRYIEQFTGHAVAFRLLADLRVGTYRDVVPLAPAGLDEDRTGDLVSRVVGDIDRVEPFYAHTIAPLSSALLVPLLTALGMAIWVDPLVGLVFLPFPLALVAVPWMRAGTVGALATTAREHAGETAALLVDSVQGAREIAIFDAEIEAVGRFEEKADDLADVRRSLSGLAAGRSGLSDLIAGLALVAVTFAAGAAFSDGSIGLSQLVAALVAGWVGTGPARALEGIVADLEQALAAAGRLFELSDRDPPVVESVETTVPPVGRGLAFRGVTLHISDGQPTLDQVDFEIPDGALVAIVGPSGGGKTSLVELLVRFRDPDVGSVLLGGADLRTLGTTELRDRIALVPQRPEIFYGSIAHNLRLAKSDATEVELWEALDKATLGGWVRALEFGLDTPIAELGESMSGGQRQRLALARAFLRSPDILILDEATSELDAAAERQILSAVKGDPSRITTIIVAHRLDTITDADEILVLDRGGLVERGTHEHLIGIDGVYAGLWRRHVDVLAEFLS